MSQAKRALGVGSAGFKHHRAVTTEMGCGIWCVEASGIQYSEPMGFIAG